MTLLGKVFTLMVFLLSVIFFTLSIAVNASHINYRDMVENKNTGLKAVLAREQAKSRELLELVDKQKDAIATEQLARRAALSSLQTQLELLTNDVAKKEELLTEKTSQLTKLTGTEQLTQQELAARTKENEELRQSLVKAREDRNAQYQKFVQAFDQYLRLQGEKKTLEEQSKELARDFTAAKEKLEIM